MSTFSRRRSDQILFRLPFPLLTCPSYSAPLWKNHRISLKPIPTDRPVPPSSPLQIDTLQALSQAVQMAASSRRSRPNFPHAILLEDDNEIDQQQTIKHDEIQSSGPTPPAGYPTSYSSPYGGTSQSPPGAHGSIPRSPSEPELISFVPAGPSSPSNSSSGPFAQYAAHESGGVPTPYTYMTPAGVVHGQGVLVHPPVSIQCHLCGLSFTRQHDLRRHHKSKHEDDKSDCLCGKSFSRKDALLRHQRADPLTGYCGCEVYQLKASLARNQ